LEFEDIDVIWLVWQVWLILEALVPRILLGSSDHFT
jgi:hypothetical protein